MNEYIPIVAVLCDLIIGDPRSRLHPVVLIGNFIYFGEKMLLCREHAHHVKIINGTLLVTVVLVAVYFLTWLYIKAIAVFSPSISFVGTALALSFTISPRSLAGAGREIQRLIEQGNMEQARLKVGWIVGRDTANLNSSEITRATVETVAENIVDGIISPLFYYAIGGLPMAFLYRAANTLDSMVGYKNEKYWDFGMPAARVDDVLNFIPARLTGILIVIAAVILRFDYRSAVKTILRDASKHPSPNSGIAEAGVAGALGIRLGGLNYYGGIPSLRAYMGEPDKPLEAACIGQTNKIMYTVTFLLVALLVLVPL